MKIELHKAKERKQTTNSETIQGHRSESTRDNLAL